MSKLQDNTRIRNSNIFRLRGIIRIFADLIPKEAYDLMIEDKEDVALFMTNLEIALDKIKRKKRTCGNCLNTTGMKISRRVKQRQCDYCGTTSEDIYVIPRQGGKYDNHRQ